MSDYTEAMVSLAEMLPMEGDDPRIRAIANEVGRLRARVEECEGALWDLSEKAGWCVTFIQSKEKMHIAGQALFLGSLDRARRVLGGKEGSNG